MGKSYYEIDRMSTTKIVLERRPHSKNAGKDAGMAAWKAAPRN
jgi:hypothetical protein